MFKSNKIKEPPKITAIRVVVLTIPTACFIAFMVAIGKIELLIGLTGYLCILFLSMALMAGFMTDIQSIVEYAKDISEGKDVKAPTLQDNTPEAASIIKSINKFHNIWSDKLKDSSLFLSDSAILDNIPDPLLFLNDNLEIIGSNLSAHELLGHNIRTKLVTDIIKTAEFKKAISEVHLKILDITSIEYIKNDKDKYLTIKILRLPAKAKGGASIMVTINDITLQKTVEQKQSEFFANASHELKTPLSVISGFVETIQTTAKDDPNAIDSFLKIIQEQTKEMTLLINNLITISRLDSEGFNQKIEKINIFEICTNLIESLSLKASEKDMEFFVSIPSNSLFIEGNEVVLNQLFRNLIDNAIKYGKESSTISIYGKQLTDNKIEFAIKNETEEPLSNIEIERFTERFFRANSSKTKKIPGTGLGLAIVQTIIANYQGNLNIFGKKNSLTINIELLSRKT